MLKQISVFLENISGRLTEFTGMLAREGIDMIALSLADTKDFGLLRIIVADYENATIRIRENGYTLTLSDVIGVAVPDKPGGLYSSILPLTQAGISVEYMYSFVRSHNGNAMLIFRVADIKAAEEILSRNGIELLDEKSLAQL